MFSLIGGMPALRAAPRWPAALVIFAGLSLVLCLAVLSAAERAAPSATAKFNKTVAAGAGTPWALPLAKPGMTALGLAKPTPALAKSTSGPADSRATKLVLQRRAWMVQTDDWIERLSSSSFWRSRSGGSGSYIYRSRSNRMSLGQSGGSSGSGAQDSGNSDSGGEPDPDAAEVTGAGSEFYTGDGDTYRTVCVRSCDGYFSPVSFSTTEDNFERDAGICESRCGSGARLYVFKNPGESPQDMVDLEGEPYEDLKTAFLFKTKYIPSCTCKPHPWSQASRDRHKVYALKATTRGKRGNSRRLAKAALRKYRRQMRRRQQITRIRTVARIATMALGGGTALPDPLNADFGDAAAVVMAPSALAERRRASLSPVRSLIGPVLPPQMQVSGADAVDARDAPDTPDAPDAPDAEFQTVAVQVTPDNDDEEIFLPVRNPIRVLSWLSRPSLVVAGLQQPERLAALTLAQVAIAASPRPLPSIEDRSAAPLVAAVPVTPENDDESIFLPVRNPIRVLSRLSRPVATAVRRADLATVVADDADLGLGGGRVVPLYGRGRIHLPVRNPHRRVASLAVRSTSRVELNLARGKTPEVAGPTAAASARKDKATSRKRRRAGTATVVRAKPRVRRKRKNNVRIARRSAMRLGANSDSRRSKSARSRNRASQSRSGESLRPSRSHWTKTVFIGLD